LKPKLLIIELWGVGDLVIATQFLRAASEKYGVTLVAKPYAQELQPRLWPELQVIPFIAPWTKFNGKYRLWQWPWRGLYRLRQQLAAAQFDVGLSARWDPRDHLLLALAGARKRLGFPRVGSGMYLNQPVTKPASDAHRYEYWCALANALDLKLPARDAIPVPPARKGKILVHTGAGQTVRVWPLERFRDLVRRLREHGFVVLVACDADQRSWWLAGGETSVSTPQTISELLKLTDGAGVFIGNDSGPGHLAAFNGVPTFTLFGPQLPEWFAPLHPQAAWIEGPICPYRPCSDYCLFPLPHCLWDLDCDTVWREVGAFVARHVDLLSKTTTGTP
jgi:heptosyltransferase-2